MQHMKEAITGMVVILTLEALLLQVHHPARHLIHTTFTLVLGPVVVLVLGALLVLPISATFGKKLHILFTQLSSTCVDVGHFSRQHLSVPAPASAGGLSPLPRCWVGPRGPLVVNSALRR